MEKINWFGKEEETGRYKFSLYPKEYRVSECFNNFNNMIDTSSPQLDKAMNEEPESIIKAAYEAGFTDGVNTMFESAGPLITEFCDDQGIEEYTDIRLSIIDLISDQK